MHDQEDPNRNAPWSRRVTKTADVGQTVIPPGGHRVVMIDTPSSSEIRDLASFRRDLEQAKVFAHEFESVDTAEIADARDPRLAFWSAAVVAYGRAFNNGVRRARIEIDN
jgi:hypothetical protein